MKPPELFYFRMFGLDCCAPWPMPMCQPLTHTPTDPIRFEFGEAPATLSDDRSAGYQNKWKQVSDGQVLLVVAEFEMRIWIAGPRLVVLDCPNNEHALNKLRPYLISTVASALINLQGRLSLHVGALLIEDKLVLVSGQSGDGKSTLTAAAIAMGWKYASDDMVALEPGDKAVIHSGIPVLKLSEQSRRILLTSGLGQAKSAPLCWPNYAEFVADQEKDWLNGSTVFDSEPRRPSALVMLNNHENISAPTLERLVGGEALAAAWQCSFRRKQSRVLLGNAQHRDRLLEFAKNQPIYRLSRCCAPDRLADELALLKSLAQ